MPIDVIPAENVAAPEVHQPESFAEVMKTWTPEERQEWDLSGKEPEEKKPTAAEPVKLETTPAPEKVEAAPATGTGTEEDQDFEEPVYTGTPDEQAKQRHAFAKLTRKLAARNAEIKILREQRT